MPGAPARSPPEEAPVTQAQLDRSVARSTGESPRTVRRLGFGLVAAPRLDLHAGGPALAVDCPHCGGRSLLPPGDPTPGAMGECGRCDVYFGFRPDAVYVVDGGRPATDAA